jgi:hypothetical protein
MSSADDGDVIIVVPSGSAAPDAHANAKLGQMLKYDGHLWFNAYYPSIKGGGKYTWTLATASNA